MPQVKCNKKALLKQSRKNKRGYPVATIAFYGPDNPRASKKLRKGEFPEHQTIPGGYLSLSEREDWKGD